MKKILLFIVYFFALISVCAAQCNEFYTITEGSEWEFENYNGKGKLTGKNHQKVTQFEKTGTGFKAIINSILYNEKGKELRKGDLEYTCNNGIIYIDMRSFIPEEQYKSFGSFEVKVESENLELPSKLVAGQTLKDGMVTVTAINSPFPMKMTVSITDRKVEGKETITTPAGSFDCFKISSKTLVKSQMAITMNLNFTNVEWIAPQAGLVKSESYNKNDKLAGYTVLSKKL